MNRVGSNLRALMKNMARSLSQLELLQSVACVDDNSPANKESYPYSLKKLVGKKYGDLKMIRMRTSMNIVIPVNTMLMIRLMVLNDVQINFS